MFQTGWGARKLRGGGGGGQPRAAEALLPELAAADRPQLRGGRGGGGGGAGASAAAAGGLQRRGRLHAAGQRQDPAHRHRRQRPGELRLRYFWSLLKIFESNPDT